MQLCYNAITHCRGAPLSFGANGRATWHLPVSHTAWRGTGPPHHPRLSVLPVPSGGSRVLSQSHQQTGLAQAQSFSIQLPFALSVSPSSHHISPFSRLPPSNRFFFLVPLRSPRLLPVLCSQVTIAFCFPLGSFSLSSFVFSPSRLHSIRKLDKPQQKQVSIPRYHCSYTHR